MPTRLETRINALVYILLGAALMLGVGKLSGVPVCSMLLNSCETDPLKEIIRLQTEIDARDKTIEKLTDKIADNTKIIQDEQARTGKVLLGIKGIAERLSKINVEGENNGEKIRILGENISETVNGLIDVIRDGAGDGG